MSLLVAGSINADLYVEIDRLPQPGETIAGSGAAVRPGGKGANQAAAAARLGMATRFAGLVGSDPFAADLRAALAATGCDVGLLDTVPGPTGQAFILLQRGGENSIVIVGGANRAWSEPPPAVLAAVATSRAVLLQREIPASVNAAIARAARAAGVPAVLDAGGDDDALPPAILPDLALLSPNETELARLTGLPTGSDAEVLAAARALQAQGVGEVLVKLGARGVLLVQRDGAVLRQDAFRVPVVDTTGAGDCCTAAYAVAWAEGCAPQERLRFACAAAALCVQARGAMPAMPARAAVDVFLRERA